MSSSSAKDRDRKALAALYALGSLLPFTLAYIGIRDENAYGAQWPVWVMVAGGILSLIQSLQLLREIRRNR
jgi:hypothetical protein